MEKDKRIRINKRMMAWSDGRRVNVIPSVYRQVDDYGRMMIEYHKLLDEGYLVDMGPCAVAREEARCREHEADHYWELGRRFEALQEMIKATSATLPDDEPTFEDVQWLNPDETLYWHPNIKEFLRLNRRCIGFCRKDSRLWPVYEESWVGRSYRKYLEDLNVYLHS